MLSDAIRDIDTAIQIHRAERERRVEMRSGFARAEAYMWQIEDMLEDGNRHVPDPLVIEIARFVRPHSRRLARQLTRDPEHDPVQVLEVLFDVQERIQAESASAAADDLPEAIAS